MYAITDLDVGAVQGADGEGAVEHELHVARPTGLRTGRTDLCIKQSNGCQRISLSKGGAEYIA